VKRSALERAAAVISIVAICTCAWGCGGGSGFTPTNVGWIAPDFTLSDVNPASPTGGLPVAVRDFIGKASAWYFGYAT
jgi:hypothetical protein